MPKLSVLIHADTYSAELQSTIEHVAFANDIMIVADEPAYEEIQKCARKLRVRVKKAIPGVTPGAYAMDTFYEWILVLRPGERLSDDIVESLKTWIKASKRDEEVAYQVRLLHGCPNELRLVNRKQMNWMGELPPSASNAAELPVAA